jgi:general stress protein YciG
LEDVDFEGAVFFAGFLEGGMTVRMDRERAKWVGRDGGASFPGAETDCKPI